MIAIVNYLTSRTDDLKQALDRVGAHAVVVGSIDGIERAGKIILPSCATYSMAVRDIRDRGFLRPLYRAVDDGRYVLGIAAGLHLLLDVSYEDGQHTGLGLVPGKVGRFIDATPSIPAVHEGWSPVYWDRDWPLMVDLHSGQRFYFSHGCFADPLDGDVIAGRCHHGIDFAALICSNRLMGTEFLPERSGQSGERLLERFARL